MRKLCKNNVPDDEFIEKKKEEILVKKVLKIKEKRRLKVWKKFVYVMVALFFASC